MRSPLIALAGATLLAAPLAVSAAPASAATCTAPELVSSSVAPRTVVVGTSLPKGFVATVGVDAHGCTVTRVDSDFLSPTGGTETFAMDEEETVDGVTTYDVGIRISPGALPNADAGRWSSAVHLSWASSSTSADGASFRVLRAATLTTNATPEPVRQGKTLTVTGTLRRANWESRTYAGYTKRHVVLQFRTLTGSYADVKTVTSRSHGKVTAKVEAGLDGCYRFVFRGSATTAKVTTKGDCVDVR